jgi:hypothetical protein
MRRWVVLSWWSTATACKRGAGSCIAWKATVSRKVGGHCRRYPYRVSKTSQELSSRGRTSRSASSAARRNTAGVRRV